MTNSLLDASHVFCKQYAVTFVRTVVFVHSTSITVTSVSNYVAQQQCPALCMANFAEFTALITKTSTYLV